ncbi:hypothetical protein B0T21DRAFT_378822 [Apiosordaria backusii]|uniref:Uncharacterized protein n=1 Tax=Apiosordaria backusii TaxID=314023 RepID=A0AA40DFV6_9PEZI|nr:hypothetical protein B0T21DRAFT_378822 [Apiosordaria backusii]
MASNEEKRVNAKRFETRLEEIDLEFQQFIATLDSSAALLGKTADLYRAESSRKETRHASEQAEVSKFMAFIAMVYLPMTAVSTIFATPVFKFEYDWIDYRGHHHPQTSSGTEGGNSSTEPKLEVLSVYFWPYLGLSILMTIITVYIYWRKSKKLKGQQSDGKLKPASAPATRLEHGWHDLTANTVTGLKSSGSSKTVGNHSIGHASATFVNSKPAEKPKASSRCQSFAPSWLLSLKSKTTASSSGHPMGPGHTAGTAPSSSHVGNDVP